MGAFSSDEVWITTRTAKVGELLTEHLYRPSPAWRDVLKPSDRRPETPQVAPSQGFWSGVCQNGGVDAVSCWGR